jgi:hypothetical protein
MRKVIVILKIIISYSSLLSQVNFNPSNNTIEVNEDMTTYIFLDNVESPSVDIGNDNVIGEVKLISPKKYLLKVKATQKFNKNTSLLIIDKEGRDIPVITVIYNANTMIGKYYYDANKKTFSNSSSLENKDVKQTSINQEKIKVQEIIEEKPSKKVIIPETKEVPVKSNTENEKKEVSNSNSDKKKYNEIFLKNRKFISGQTTSHFRIELFNIVKFKKENKLYYCFDINNKTSSDFEIEEVIVEIIRKSKGRGDISELVENITFSDKILKAGDNYLLVSSDAFSIDNNEFINITIIEKTNYGTGKKMKTNIRYKDLIEIISI